MRDTTKIYLDIASHSPLWISLHRDATCLEKDAFTATHRETIHQHYLETGRCISAEEAHEMAHEVWWDVRMLGVDPTIELHMPPAPYQATAIGTALPTAPPPAMSAGPPPNFTQHNVGNTDRVIRAILGALLIVSTARSNGWVGGLIGAVLLATAYLRFCPTYRALDFSTLKDHGTARDEAPLTK